MLKKLFFGWTKFEICLLLFSIIAIIISFFSGEEWNFLSLFTSLFGVTGILFVAKGLISGQWLSIVFLALYAILSFQSAYYGEMILVLFFSLPSTLFALISWMKNPSKERGKVRVNKISKPEWIFLSVAVVLITVGAYFLLSALNTAEVVVSTVSFVTSIFAAYLLIRRSAYYAVFYFVNDLILIVLWSLALFKGASVLPSIISYFVFLINDSYGFFEWRRREKTE